MGNLLKEFIVGTTFVIVLLTTILFVFITVPAQSAPKTKFYDFQDQIIDGEIKKPVTLYTDARKRVKFERLLKLKKSFLNRLYNSAKERVFK